VVVQSERKCGASQFEEVETGGGAEQHEISSNGLWAMGSEAESSLGAARGIPKLSREDGNSGGRLFVDDWFGRVRDG
jgi:hypothetical protein